MTPLVLVQNITLTDAPVMSLPPTYFDIFSLFLFQYLPD